MGQSFRIMIVAMALVALLAGYLAGEHLRGPGSGEDSGAGVPAGIPSMVELVNQQAAAVIGSARPEVVLKDLDARPRNLQEWSDKLLVVNFWATWCPPCREEIPGFVRLQAHFAEQGVQFLGVALDSVENVQTFLTEQPMNYPTLLGEQDAMQAATAFGNSSGALPYTALVGTDGTILDVHAGELSEQSARQMIERHLAPKQP